MSDAVTYDDRASVADDSARLTPFFFLGFCLDVVFKVRADPPHEMWSGVSA